LKLELDNEGAAHRNISCVTVRCTLVFHQLHYSINMNATLSLYPFIIY